MKEMDIIVEMTTRFGISFHLDFLDNQEGYAFIDEYKGVFFYENEDGIKEAVIGEFEVRVFNIAGALENNYDIDELFDLNDSYYEFYTYLFGGKSPIFSSEDDYFNYLDDVSRICILDTLKIKKYFRKKGFSNLLIKEIIRRFSDSFDIMLAKPFPINLSGKFKTHKNEIKEATSKLIKLYCSTGAVQLKPSDEIVMWDFRN